MSKQPTKKKPAKPAAKPKRLTISQMRKRILARLDDGRGPARDPDSVACYYRKGGRRNGLPCAVGCLIPNEHYTKEMETAALNGIGVQKGRWIPNGSWRTRSALAKALNASGIPGTPEVSIFLSEWQRRHDATQNWAGNKYIGPRD